MSAIRHFCTRTAFCAFFLPALLLAITPTPASAAAKATTTTLAITSGTGPVTSISGGTAVTLTAAVTASGTPVTAGLVNFCDAAAAYCTDIHLLGFAGLTTSGTAAFTFVPGPGIHSYKAEYAGTSGSTGYAASSSAASSLTVNNVSTTTTITQSGSAGAYTLKATVVGTGSVTGPTGAVSFLDTSNQNAVLGTATLGTTARALNWTTPQPPVTAPEPNSIAVADFNGDGIPDIAIATNGTTGTSGIGSVQILLGTGDGTFQAAKTYVGLSGNQLIVAAPFITGGPEDLLVVNNAASAKNDGTANNGLLFTGDGKGNFQAGTPFRTGVDSITAIVTGDLNGDGIQDYVLAGTVFGTSVFGDTFGNGTGTFGLTTLNAINSLPITVAALGVGDFRGTGALDIAIIESDGETEIFANNTAGYFFPFSTPPSVGASSTAIAVGDFNGDSNADLAITNGTQDNVTILLGNGAGIFTAAASPSTGATPMAIAIGDFNGDGVPDLAVANSGDGTATILLGKGDGTFTALPAFNTGNTPVSLAVGTFNGNETADIAVTNQAPGSTLGSTATVLLSQLTQTATATATNISPIGTGTMHLVDASYAGDSIFANSVSSTTSLTGIGGTQTVTIAPTSLAFTGQAGSTSAVQTVQLTNTGTAAVSISSVSATSNFAGSSACGNSLAPGANCLISVTFVPTSTGNLTGTLSISDTAAGSPQTVGLSGTATAPPPTITPASLTFASQLIGTTSAAQMVTVANKSNYPVTINSVAASAGYAVSSACGTSVAANTSCLVSVTFVPTTAGTVTGTATFASNATGSPQTVTLSGTATTPPPTVTVAPASLTYTALAVGSSSTAQTVTLTNSGSVAVSVTSIAASGDFSETNTCGSSVAVGASCTIAVVFTPTTAGARSGTLTITDNATGAPQTVALTGTGTSVLIAPTSTSLTISSAGGSATDVITLSSAQGFSGTVNLSCAVTYQGTGTPTDPPTCSISPSSGTVTASTTLTSTLTVSTTGTGSSQSAYINPHPKLFGGQGSSRRALLPAGISLAALLFIGFLPRRRWRTMRFVVLLALSLGCAFAAVGCGGSNNNQTKGTTAGSYQVVVTATSGTVTVTSAISLSVQ